MRHLIEELDIAMNNGELVEGWVSSKPAKKTIDAFLDKKPAECKKLKTDGKRLDGLWMGGRGIAEWKGGKIVFGDLGSKAAESVQKAIKKAAPKNWLSEDALDEGARESQIAVDKWANALEKKFNGASIVGMAVKSGDEVWLKVRDKKVSPAKFEGEAKKLSKLDWNYSGKESGAMIFKAPMVASEDITEDKTEALKKKFNKLWVKQAKLYSKGTGNWTDGDKKIASDIRQELTDIEKKVGDEGPWFDEDYTDFDTEVICEAAEELVESGPLVPTGRNKVSSETQAIAKKMGKIIASKDLLQKKWPRYKGTGTPARSRKEVVDGIMLQNNASYMGHTQGGRIGLEGKLAAKTLYFFAATPFSASGAASDIGMPVYLVFSTGKEESEIHYWVATKPITKGTTEDTDDGELSERKYYILVGKEGGELVMIFGDYDKETVEYEKDSESLSYKKMKILTLPNASQKTIDAKMAKLNEDELDEEEENDKDKSKSQGRKQYIKMEKMLDKPAAQKWFDKNDVTVKKMPSTGSFILKGKSSDKIMQFIDLWVGTGLMLFGEYGYSAIPYKNQKIVFMKNFNLYTDAKWREIWKLREEAGVDEDDWEEEDALEEEASGKLAKAAKGLGKDFNVKVEGKIKGGDAFLVVSGGVVDRSKFERAAKKMTGAAWKLSAVPDLKKAWKSDWIFKADASYLNEGLLDEGKVVATLDSHVSSLGGPIPASVHLARSVADAKKYASSNRGSIAKAEVGNKYKYFLRIGSEVVEVRPGKFDKKRGQQDFYKEDIDLDEAKGSSAGVIKALADTDYKDKDAFFKMAQLLKGLAAAADEDKAAKAFLSKVSDGLTTAAKGVSGDGEAAKTIKVLADTDYKDKDAFFKMSQLLKGLAAAADEDKVAKEYLSKVSDALTTAAKGKTEELDWEADIMQVFVGTADDPDLSEGQKYRQIDYIGDALDKLRDQLEGAEKAFADLKKGKSKDPKGALSGIKKSVQQIEYIAGKAVDTIDAIKKDIKEDDDTEDGSILNESMKKAPKQRGTLILREDDFARGGASVMNWNSMLDEFNIPYGEEADFNEPEEVELKVTGVKYE